MSGGVLGTGFMLVALATSVELWNGTASPHACSSKLKDGAAVPTYTAHPSCPASPFLGTQMLLLKTKRKTDEVLKG